MFFDLQDVLDEEMFLSFVVSERGAGKTFSSLKKLIEIFLKTGEQFVYLRRSQTELESALPTIFDPFQREGFFLEHNFSVRGEFLYIDNKCCGRGIAISTAYKLKSVGFPNVKYILFDEFISENGQYIKEELHKFLSCIETIGRMRDIYVIALANQSTIYNPYYVYFQIKPASKQTPKTRFRQKSILVYQFISTEYREVKQETKFGKLIRGTKYGSFMLENEAIQDNYQFVDKMDGYKKKPFVNMLISGENIVAYDCETKDGTIVYFQIREAIKDIPSYNFDKQLEKDRIIDNVRNNPYVRRISLYVNRGMIAFRDIRVKNIIEDFIF